MDRPWMFRLAAVVIAVSLLIATPGLAQEGPATGPRGPEIVIGGEGMRTVPADRASVIVAVETRARTPSQASALNAARNNAIRAAIVGLGVPREDVATYGYMVYRYRDDPRLERDTTFITTNAVRVTLRRPEQLPLLGRVIDTALTAGATNVSGVNYQARRTDDAERAALADALADARARAEAIARGAGGSLGELLQVSGDVGAFGAEMMLRGTGGMARARSERMIAEPTTVTAGEIEVRQYVVARWRFMPGAR